MPDLTIIDLPSFRADPAKYGVRSETVIACDLTRKIILIGGTAYAGAVINTVGRLELPQPFNAKGCLDVLEFPLEGGGILAASA